MAKSASKSLARSKWHAIMILLVVAFISSASAGIDISQIINVNDIQQQLPAELPNTNFTIDDAKKLIRDKCIAVAGEHDGNVAYENFESSIMNSMECITNIVNFTAIQEEIVEASPRGELDVVFNKYCNKRDEAVQCVEKFNEKLLPCLDEEEKMSQDMFMRIVNSLLNFICHKGGDQIALFIAEKGPECLESKREGIEQCINNTFSDYVPKEGIDSIKTLPKFVMGPKQCEDFDHFQTCIVSLLETCNDITPANIVESMLRFVKNETICRNTPSTHGHRTSDASTIVHISGLGTMLALLVVAIKRIVA